MRASTTALRGAAPRKGPEAPFTLPRLRAPLVFGLLALLFAGLTGRSVYLQSIDNEFLQTQGSARHSRDLEVPAHRGRISVGQVAGYTAGNDHVHQHAMTK